MMSKKKCPLVSIIMSTKDTPEYMLRASIESILNQKYHNFEFIIVNDGCEEDLRIIKSYNDKRIIIINHIKSVGLPKSLNEAINICNGKYVARMDSDDISLSNRLYLQVKYMEKNDNIDICSTLTKSFGNNSKFNINMFFDDKGIKSELFLHNIIVHPSVMIRRSFLINNSIYYNVNFKYSQDYELWCRCINKASFAIISKVCLLYRVHNKQISTAKIDEQNELCRKILSENLKKVNLVPSKDNLDMMFFLCQKKKFDIGDGKRIDSFINKVCNVEKGVFDINKLKKVLLYNYCTILLKEKKVLLSLPVIIKSNFFFMYIRKMFIKIPFLLFNKEWRKYI